MLLLLAATARGMAAGAEGKKPFQAEDWLREETISAGLISPAGKALVFSRTSEKPGGPVADIGMFSAEAPEPRRITESELTKENYGESQWSPDGRYNPPRARSRSGMVSTIVAQN